MLNRVHVLGRKNHGKTQLIVELVDELDRRGLRVGTIKHTHHHHELDTPGKDSHRHRRAGAAAVGILSPAMSAVFLPQVNRSADTDRYAVMAPLFADCDVVLVEGDSCTTAPKIEVWRSVHGTVPMAMQDASIMAVVTDDPLPIATPVRSRSDVGALATWLLEVARGELLSAGGGRSNQQRSLDRVSLSGRGPVAENGTMVCAPEELPAIR